MSMTERERLANALFGSKERELLNVRFMKGTSPTLTSEEMCRAASTALEAFWSKRPGELRSKFPKNGREQREGAEVLATY